MKKVLHQKTQSVSLMLVRTVVDRDVLALDEACILQALVERSHAVDRHISERSTTKKPYRRRRWLLRLRHERRCRRSAEQRDELAPLHGHSSSGLGPHITTPLRKYAAVHHSKTCARMSQMGHVWTAPAVQEESDYQRSIRVRSCIRPVVAWGLPLSRCSRHGRWP